MPAFNHPELKSLYVFLASFLGKNIWNPLFFDLLLTTQKKHKNSARAEIIDCSDSISRSVSYFTFLI